MDLNRCRIDLLQKKSGIIGHPDQPEVDVSQHLMPRKAMAAMGQEALDFLKKFGPSNYSPFFDERDIDRSSFGGILQGAYFTAAVVRWLATCWWPPNVEKGCSQSDDWGISRLELLFSFVLFSGIYPPVKTGGQKSKAVFGTTPQMMRH